MSAGERDAGWWAGECDVMEIMRGSCSHCRKLPDLPVRAEHPERAGRTGVELTVFVARFDGECVECRGIIVKGDTIAQLAVGRYACEECAPWVS